MVWTRTEVRQRVLLCSSLELGEIFMLCRCLGSSLNVCNVRCPSAGSGGLEDHSRLFRIECGADNRTVNVGGISTFPAGRLRWLHREGKSLLKKKRKKQPFVGSLHAIYKHLWKRKKKWARNNTFSKHPCRNTWLTVQVIESGFFKRNFAMDVIVFDGYTAACSGKWMFVNIQEPQVRYSTRDCSRPSSLSCLH